MLNPSLLLALAWVFGSLAEHVCYPALMGVLLACILFEPALLGILPPSGALDVLAEIGVFLLMIYVGTEVDIHDLFELGPQPLLVALGGFVLPFALGNGLGEFIGLALEQSLFIGIAMAATSLATKSRILVDLDILDTRIAGVLLGGALLSDVGVIVVFAGVSRFIETGGVTVTELAIVAGQSFLFFAVVLAIGDRFLPHVWEALEEWMEAHEFADKTSAFTVALLVALLFSSSPPTSTST